MRCTPSACPQADLEEHADSTESIQWFGTRRLTRGDAEDVNSLSFGGMPCSKVSTECREQCMYCVFLDERD
jgi:hypothetical protein